MARQNSPGKHRLLFIVLGVVLGIHLAVLLPFMLKGCAPAADPAPAPEPPVQPLYREPNPTLPAVSSTAPSAHSARGRFHVASALPRFGAPFDFSGAIRGDLKELPGARAARTGIMVDMNTRKVLWEKESDRSVPVASMVKMMTLLLACEELESNAKLTLDTPVPVTQAAAKIGGSQIWLDTRETFPLSDLLMAVAIKSANDAAYQVGEFIGGGDMNAFIARMNRRAGELGMINTRFTSCHGLPIAGTPNSVSSAADMVRLGERLLEYPQLMTWAGTQVAYIRGDKTMLSNHNKLVRPQYPGVDGLKTGFIDKSGFCVTVSALRDNRRILLCVTGFSSANERDVFARKLLDWGYAH